MKVAAQTADVLFRFSRRSHSRNRNDSQGAAKIIQTDLERCVCAKASRVCRIAALAVVSQLRRRILSLPNGPDFFADARAGDSRQQVMPADFSI